MASATRFLLGVRTDLLPGAPPMTRTHVDGPIDYKGMWQIIAYEKKGASGQRAVTDVRGRPMTVPENDFQNLKFVGGHKPSS